MDFKLKRAAKLTLIAAILYVIAVSASPTISHAINNNAEHIYIFGTLLSLVFILAGTTMVLLVRLVGTVDDRRTYRTKRR